MFKVCLMYLSKYNINVFLTNKFKSINDSKFKKGIKQISEIEVLKFSNSSSFRMKLLLKVWLLLS